MSEAAFGGPRCFGKSTALEISSQEFVDFTVRQGSISAFGIGKLIPLDRRACNHYSTMLAAPPPSPSRSDG